MPSLSIVVPCYNEEACLGVLHERLTGAAKSAAGDDYEIVLVNDGSRDGSWPIMQGLAEADPHVVARGAVVRGRDLRAIRPPFARVLPDLSPAPALGEHTSEVLQACYNRQLGSEARERP